MPTRIVREGCVDSLRVNALRERTENFYKRLFHVVDDFGRYEAGLQLLCAKVWGMQPQRTVDDVAACLEELSAGDRPLVILYTAGSKRYLQIQDFGQRERTSKFPAPPDSAQDCGEVRQDAARASHPTPRSTPRSTPPPKGGAVGANGDEAWSSLQLAAANVGMRASAEELKLCHATWNNLTGAEQLAAIVGIAERASDEYGTPAYVPLLENYLRKKLWTRPLKPRSHSPPAGQRSGRKAQAEAEFLARIKRDQEIANEEGTDGKNLIARPERGGR